VALVASLALAASLGGWAAGKASGEKNATRQVTDGDADADLPAAKPDTVRIWIRTVPPRKAQVKWGRKLLGIIPAPKALVIERPRDSGPMDLVIRAGGFLPVHTRAYTFDDSRVSVKLTPPSQKSRLFGYKQEIVPPLDAGVPPPAADPPKE